MFPAKDPANGKCTADNFVNSSGQAETCTEFVYDRSVFSATLSTELDLVCDLENRQKLLGTLLMLGILIGSVIGGWASDHFGRKRTMYAAALVSVPALTANGFATNYPTYAALHFIYCTAIPILWMTNLTLNLELFSSRYKKVLLWTKCLMWTLCNLLMVLLAYVARTWTHQHVVLGVIGLLALATWPLIPESPRWLAQNGRQAEARALMLEIARANGESAAEDDEALDELISHVAAKAEQERMGEERRAPLTELFRPHFLTTTLILTSAWTMANAGYYTLSLHAASLHGDLFLNYALSFGINCAKAFMLWGAVERCGRRNVLAFAEAVVAVCCLALAFTPKERTTLVLVIFLVGNLCCACTFNLCWFITPDFYPTNLRAQGCTELSIISLSRSLIEQQTQL